MSIFTRESLHNYRAYEARREGGVEGVSYPGPAMFRGALSARNTKYARMYHFEKKNSKMFSPERPRENVWGAPRECFPGPRCGSRRAWCVLARLQP